MTRPTRLRRSELSTPGTSEKMIVKAAASSADLVFLDLEDAVAPAEKEKARQPIVAALNDLDWGTKTRAVRINGTHTHWCADDLTAVVEGAGARLDVVIIPKVKAPRDVWFVDTLLTQLETQAAASGRAASASRSSSRRPRPSPASRSSRGVLPPARGAHPRRRRPVRQPGHAAGPDRRDRRPLSGRRVALRPQPHDRGRPGGRHRSHRRAVRRHPQRRRLPAGGDVGVDARRGGQVGHPPEPDRHRQRGLRAHRGRDHPAPSPSSPRCARPRPPAPAPPPTTA